MFLLLIFGFAHVIFGYGAVDIDGQLEYHLPSPDKIFIKTRYDQFDIKFVKYNGGYEHEIPHGTKYYKIDKLQPCTKYNFEFIGTARESNKHKLVQSEITTDVGTHPPLEIQIASVNSTAVNIKFNFSQIDCVDFVQITMNEHNITFINRNIPKSFIKNSLAPCTRYDVVIMASIKGHRYLLFQEAFTTQPVEIKPVQNINFIKSNNSLTWEQPLSSETSCALIYDVILRRDSVQHKHEEIMIQTSKQYVELQKLRPCSYYVVAITPNERNDLNTTYTFKSGYAEPGPVESVTGDIKNETQLDIKWNSPSVNIECVLNYIIIVNGIKTRTRDNSFVMTTAEPCETYDVSVCSSTSRENCVNTTFNFSNWPVLQVGNVTNITRRYENTDTYFTWLPPIFGAKCVKQYFIELCEGPTRIYSAYSKTATISFSNLAACTEYVIGIKCISGTNKTISLTSIYKFIVDPQKSDQTVLELISRTSTSLTLKLKYDNPNKNCQIELVRFVCQLELPQKLIINQKLEIESNNFQVTFRDLKPSSKYLCHVLIRNKAHWSDEPKSRKIFATDIALCAQYKFNIKNRTTESILVSWNNKMLVNKTIFITKLNHNYELPENCTCLKFEKEIRIKWDTSQYEFKNLIPATNYEFKMEVQDATGIKQNTTTIINGSTFPEAPPKVLNARVAEITIIPSITIQWNLPCLLNGNVDQIDIKFIGHPKIYSSPVHNWTISINIGKPQQRYTYTNNEIYPDYRYNVTITTVRNLNKTMISSDETLIKFVTPPKRSDIYQLDDWGTIAATEFNSKIQIFPMVKENLAHLLHTNLSLIHNITLLIQNQDDCGVLQPAYKLYDLDHKVYESILSSSNQNCTNEYRVYARTNRLLIGDCLNHKTSCKPLEKGTSYQILIRVYTLRGFADTSPISFKTESTIGALLIVLIMIIICLVIMISCAATTIWLYAFKHNRNIEPYTQLQVKRFTEQFATLDPNIITDEFTTISKFNLSNNIRTSVGSKYTTKNRYTDILPYDFNRVVLTPNKFCNVDYINASYINSFCCNPKFIATQGPTIETTYDFWHMVIEKECHKIVMVTQLTENGIKKCFQYFPNLNDEITFNDVTIKNCAEICNGACTRRELIISQARRPTSHSVIHYQFNKWPDYGCPENKMDLINLVELVKKEGNPSELIIVHCSAGVGRTGTFIALDILMDHVKHTKHLDIFKTVKQLRKERTESVQTVEQYRFLYSCIDEYIKRSQSD